MCVQSALFRFHTSLFAGCIVLKVSQGLSIDLLSLLQVKKLGHKNDTSVFVAPREVFASQVLGISANRGGSVFRLIG